LNPELPGVTAINQDLCQRLDVLESDDPKAFAGNGLNLPVHILLAATLFTPERKT
jgi:hypothetical protein